MPSENKTQRIIRIVLELVESDAERRRILKTLETSGVLDDSEVEWAAAIIKGEEYLEEGHDEN